MQTVAWIALAVSLGGAGMTNAPTPAEIGYAVGYDLGLETVEQLGLDGVNADAVELAQGFADAVLEKTPRLDDVIRRQVLTTVELERASNAVKARMADDPMFAALVDANLRRSEAFHASLRSAEGITTLPSGVQYLVRRAGSGATPGEDSRVVVTYSLQTLDGVEVASESLRELDMGYLLDGAADAMTRMPAGSIWQIALPPSKALGLGGQPPEIGPNESVILEVQLHEVR